MLISPSCPIRKLLVFTKKYKVFYKWWQCQASDSLWSVCIGEATQHRTQKIMAITAVVLTTTVIGVHSLLH